MGEGQKKNKKSVGAFLGEKGRGEAGERCRRRCMRMMQLARDGAFRREELLGSWRKCQLDSKPVRRTISIVLVTGGEIIILQNVRLLRPVAGGGGEKTGRKKEKERKACDPTRPQSIRSQNKTSHEG